MDINYIVLAVGMCVIFAYGYYRYKKSEEEIAKLENHTNNPNQ